MSKISLLPSDVWKNIFAFSNSMYTKQDVIQRFGCHPPYQWSYEPPKSFLNLKEGKKKLIWDCRQECVDKDPQWIEYMWNNLPKDRVKIGGDLGLPWLPLFSVKRFGMGIQQVSYKGQTYQIGEYVWTQFETNLGLYFDGPSVFRSMGGNLPITPEQVPSFLTHYYKQGCRDFDFTLNCEVKYPDYLDVKLTENDSVYFDSDKTAYYNSRPESTRLVIYDDGDDESIGIEIILNPLPTTDEEREQSRKIVYEADPIIAEFLKKTQQKDNSIS